MTYMPVDGKPDRVHVGARALNLDDWFEINEDYEDYVAYKLKLLRKHFLITHFLNSRISLTLNGVFILMTRVGLIHFILFLVIMQ